MEDRLSHPWDLLVGDWFSRTLPAPTPRRARTLGLPGKADAIVGMRRSGKTWMLLGEIAARRASGVPPERSLYLSLEDERLVNLESSELGGLLDAWWRRYPEVATGPCWLVLDEVQNVPGWERFVRRVLDRGQVQIAVTGSSARLLSREIATALRGRSLATEVLPFGFDEVLAHRGLQLPARWPPGEAERAMLQHHADRYLEEGGFPEVVDLPAVERERILHDYVDVVLFRDVVERHAATNVPALRRLVRRFASAPGTSFSVHRFYNDLRSQGIGVSKDTLHAYVDHMEDAFLVFRVPIFSDSERVRAVNPVKTYSVDTGLSRAFAARAEPGHLLENAVYLELRRRGGDIAWLRTRSGFEVDFVVQGNGTMQLFQVCADPSAPDTRERELRAVGEAMAELGLDRATVVTRLHEEEVRVGAGSVRFVPAWRWLVPGG
jgi:predicted AAA+ superfamily ATPase